MQLGVLSWSSAHLCTCHLHADCSSHSGQVWISFAQKPVTNSSEGFVLTSMGFNWKMWSPAHDYMGMPERNSIEEWPKMLFAALVECLLL